MASKIKVKVKLKGDVAEVKSLMMHPMETGARKDPDSGATIPALDRFFTAMDSAFGYGAPRDPTLWWRSDMPEYGIDTTSGKG